MLVKVGVATGVAPLVTGRPAPLQVNEVAPPEGLAKRFTVPPTHIGPSFVGEAVGAACTLTVVVYIVAGEHPLLPLPSVTVNVYILMPTGVAVVLAPEVLLRAGPLHTKTDAPPAGFAARFTVPPLQI